MQEHATVYNDFFFIVSISFEIVMILIAQVTKKIVRLRVKSKLNKLTRKYEGKRNIGKHKKNRIVSNGHQNVSNN